MTNQMQVSEMDTYTILSHSLFPKSPSAVEEMAHWCETTIGPMDEDWTVTLNPITAGESRAREAIWVFRRANDALAFSLHFRGRK